MKKLTLSMIAAMLIVMVITICNSFFEINAETHSSVVAAPLEGAITDNIAGMGWVVECVDCPKHFTSMTDRSLRFDSTGYPHIAYGDDHLYYAWYDGVTWLWEIVDDEPGVGSYASLALGEDGYAHISYYDDTFDDLKYAYQDDSGWHTQTLDSEGEVGANTALAVDAQGHAHIAYADETNEDLKYAFQDASGWHTERVDSAKTGPHISIALSTTGIPYISYFDDTEDWVDIKYAYRSAGSWTIWSVPTPIIGTGGGFTSIVLDENDYPHISYYTGYDTYNLGYGYRDATGWHFTTVDSEGSVGPYTSLALDSDAYPRITYLDWTNNTVKYAFQDNFGWHLQTISSGAASASHPSLALDQNGYAHISFLDDDKIKYAYQDSTDWHSEIIDSGTTAGLYNSLKLDADGYPHISYRRGTELWYAYQDATGWYTQTVDNDADVGRYSSLALDRDGYAHISYYDETNLDLKYAYLDASGWHRQTVDSAGNVGLDTSLAVDQNGYPHISYQYYYSFQHTDLKYAYQDSSGWHFHTLDSGGQVGWDTSLALDSNGYSHISYADFTERCLKYTYEDESGWHTPQIIDNSYGTGQVSSLAVDVNDYPHISYQDYNDFWDRDLKYAYKDNDGWHILPIVDVAGVRDTSLELDMDGYPRIVYPDGTFNRVIYVYEDDAGWDYQLLESIVDADMVSDRMISLELNGDGYPRLSYYNSTNSDLIYVAYVEVLEPVANFTASPTSGVAPLSVAFTNASTGYYTSILWDFGDGQTSTRMNPVHTYETDGIFTITLTVSGSGGTDILTRPDYITVITEDQFFIYLPLTLHND